MGQGTLTGLAQMVAGELECDWSKVTTEYPTPGQNLARNRVWGNFSTDGSRSIRESHEYARKGGATARQMLIQAVGSLQRRLRNCLTGVRAELWPADAIEYTELELHLVDRAAGLPIETPAVRP